MARLQLTQEGDMRTLLASVAFRVQVVELEAKQQPQKNKERRRMRLPAYPRNSAPMTRSLPSPPFMPHWLPSTQAC
eukprot:748090-Amphidinium_carterae.1